MPSDPPSSIWLKSKVLEQRFRSAAAFLSETMFAEGEQGLAEGEQGLRERLLEFGAFVCGRGRKLCVHAISVEVCA